MLWPYLFKISLKQKTIMLKKNLLLIFLLLKFKLSKIWSMGRQHACKIMCSATTILAQDCKFQILKNCLAPFEKLIFPHNFDATAHLFANHNKGASSSDVHLRNPKVVLCDNEGTAQRPRAVQAAQARWGEVAVVTWEPAPQRFHEHARRSFGLSEVMCLF